MLDFDLDAGLKESSQQEVSLTLENKIVMIGGRSKSGKTALIHEIMNMLCKEHDFDYTAMFAFMEDRYNLLNKPRKYIPPLKDYRNEDLSLRENIKIQNPTHFYNYEHLKGFVDGVVEYKKANPEYGLKVICLDPISTLEELIKNYITWKYYDDNGVSITANKWGGGYGAIYEEMGRILFEELLSPLMSVGIKPWFIFHMKTKTKKEKGTDEEYSVEASENSTGIFSKVSRIVDFSIIFENTAYVNNKKLETKERVIRYQAGDGYEGAMCSSPYVPETQNIHGQTDAEIANTVYSTLKYAMGKAAGLEDDKLEEAINKQRSENEIAIINSMKHQQELNNIAESKKEQSVIRLALLRQCETILQMNIPRDMLDAWSKIFNEFITSTGSINLKTACESSDVEKFNKVVSQVNGAFSNVSGYVKLKEL